MMGAKAPPETNGDKRPAVGICIADERLRGRVRRALRRAGFRVVADEPTLGALNGTAADAELGCIVLATEHPGPESAAAAKRVRAASATARIVFVCATARPGDARRAIAQGVDGIVLSEDVEETIAAAVADVCTGQLSIPRGLRSHVDPRGALTAREREILRLVVAGLTNAEIARRMYLAESTIKSHLTSAFAKLGVSSRHEATSVLLDPEAGRGLGVALREPLAGRTA